MTKENPERVTFLEEIAAKHANKMTQAQILTFMQKYATPEEVHNFQVYLISNKPESQQWFHQRNYFYKEFIAPIKSIKIKKSINNDFFQEILNL